MGVDVIWVAALWAWLWIKLMPMPEANVNCRRLGGLQTCLASIPGAGKRRFVLSEKSFKQTLVATVLVFLETTRTDMGVRATRCSNMYIQ